MTANSILWQSFSPRRRADSARTAQLRWSRSTAPRSGRHRRRGRHGRCHVSAPSTRLSVRSTTTARGPERPRAHCVRCASLESARRIKLLDVVWHLRYDDEYQLRRHGLADPPPGFDDRRHREPAGAAGATRLVGLRAGQPLVPRRAMSSRKSGGSGDAFGRCAHLRRDLAGPSGVFAESGCGAGRRSANPGWCPKSAVPKPTSSCSTTACPHRLIEPEPEDQRRDSGPQAGGRGAGAAVVDDRAASRKDGRVVHLAHDLDVVDIAGHR